MTLRAPKCPRNERLTRDGWARGAGERTDEAHDARRLRFLPSPLHARTPALDRHRQLRRGFGGVGAWRGVCWVAPNVPSPLTDGPPEPVSHHPLSPATPAPAHGGFARGGYRGHGVAGRRPTIGWLNARSGTGGPRFDSVDERGRGLDRSMPLPCFPQSAARWSWSSSPPPTRRLSTDPHSHPIPTQTTQGAEQPSALKDGQGHPKYVPRACVCMRGCGWAGGRRGDGGGRNGSSGGGATDRGALLAP